MRVVGVFYKMRVANVGWGYTAIRFTHSLDFLKMGSPTGFFYCKVFEEVPSPEEMLHCHLKPIFRYDFLSNYP